MKADYRPQTVWIDEGWKGILSVFQIRMDIDEVKWTHSVNLNTVEIRLF